MRQSSRRSRSWWLAPLLLLPLLGNSVAPASLAGRAEAAALSVRAVSPAPDTTEVTAATAITVAFDRPLVQLTGVNEAAAPSPLVSDPPLRGTGRWATTSLYIYQAHQLRAATIYRLRIPAGLRAVDGTRLQQPYSWQFSTLRPALRDVYPPDGYAYAVPRPDVSITFNQPMDHASTQTAFQLRDVAGGPIAGAFTWRDGTLVFRPAQPLARGTTYVASLAATARSAEGPLPMAQSTIWRFSTAAYLTVTGSTPAAGADPANMNDGVTISFSAPVSEASAIDAVRITPDLVNRSIQFGDDDLSLRIYGSFKPSTLYTVSLRAGVLARAGDRLAMPFSFHFVSAPLPAQLYFVTGSIATYSAYSPLVLSLQAINPGPITYTVYALDRASFINDLNSLYDLANRLPASSAALLTASQDAHAPLNRSVPLRVTLQLPGKRSLPAGYYLVRVVGSGDAVDYQLILVTRTNATLKVSQRQVLVWATDLASGKPVANLPFQISSRNPAATASGRTHEDGTALLRIPGVRADQSLVNGTLLLTAIRSGDAIVASSNWSNGITPSSYGLSSSGAQSLIRLTISTDRPIYRPGQTIQLRGIARADDDGRYSVVSAPATIVVTDPKGQIVARRIVALDRFGAFHATFALATNASLGGYGLSASIGSQSSYSSIQVAEYRKPTFTVEVQAGHGSYTQGETIVSDVRVRYYFGGPVTHARVHWSLLGYDYVFYSDPYSDYNFGAYDPAATLALAPDHGLDVYRPGNPTFTLSQGNAMTDAAGDLHLRLPATLPGGRTMLNYSLEANVTDLDNQPVAGKTSVVVYGSQFLIGLQSEKQVIDPGVPQRVGILTLANDGSTPAGDKDVRLAIYRRVYHNEVVHNKDGSVSQNYIPHDTFLRAENVRTDAHGRAMIRFAAPAGGDYHLVADARDRYGNRAESTLEIYAGGAKPIDWGFQTQGHIRMVTDRRTYHSGDTAHILVTTPSPGMQALISIERGGILAYSTRTLAGTATTLDVPVPASYLPDTYVSVVAVRGGANGSAPDWRLGYARIHVDPTERALRLSVTPTQGQVRPGQPLTLRIHAKDRQGHPVQAQLALSVVDAAALALAGDSGAGSDLLDAFYGLRELGVTTANTLNLNPDQLLAVRGPVQPLAARGFSANESAALPAPAASAVTHGTAVRQSPGGGPAIAVRRNFADTAYWNPTVLTDAHGNGTLTVPLPDNLTTWHILVEGITVDTLVGAATANVVATKDLLLRPLTPRFLALGDQALVGATVNNGTGQAMRVQLQLLTANGAVGGLPAPAVVGQRLVMLAAHGELSVTWPLTAGTLGTATIEVRALDSGNSAVNDAVAVTLPVQENSTPEDVATAGGAGAHTQEAVQIPAGLVPNEGSLSIMLEPTLAAGLQVGADFLRSYPYDSSTDLAARILGQAELGRLPARAAVLTVAQQRALAPEIDRLLARLYPLQRGDGGFGWWIDDPISSAYLTVPVVEALTVARNLGYAVKGDVLSSAVVYLIAQAKQPTATNAGTDDDADLQAGIVYAVSQYGRGTAVAAVAGGLFENRTLLSHQSAAELAIVLHGYHTGADDGRVQTLLADLTSAARISGSSVHWDEAGYSWRGLDSDIASTAGVLDALTVLQPRSPLIAGAVRWLMAARTVDAWGATYSTAISLQGLVDYITASGELNGNYRYTVSRNNSLWGSGTVNAGNLARDRVLSHPLAGSDAGTTQRITVAREVRPNNGQLHYVVRLHYFRPVDQIAATSQGVGVSRRYLTPDRTGGALGSTIRVQLTVTAPQDLFYLTLEDPLPAGAESVDSSLQTTSQLAQINSQSGIPQGTSDLSWYVTHTDLRDNRTVLFLDYLPAGSYQYTYLIHLSTQGLFHTLPAHIQQSYFPEVFGRSTGSYFRVR